MRQIPLNEMTFQELQIFLVAGQTLNFTRTAEKCFVTQPTVSRAIDSVEKKTGIHLFIKSRGKLRLSPAGKVLHKKVQAGMEMLQEGFERAWEAQEGFRKIIQVGIAPNLDASAFVDSAHQYMDQEKDSQIYLRQVDSVIDGLSQLLALKLDIYIAYAHERMETKPFLELSVETLCEGPLICYMTEKNPLAGKKEITYKDLQSEKIILPKSGTNQLYEAMFMEKMAEVNVTPLISVRVANAQEALMNLHKDHDVVILDQYVSQNELLRKLVPVPISGSKSGLIAIYRTADQNQPGIRKLLESMKEFLNRSYKE